MEAPAEKNLSCAAGWLSPSVLYAIVSLTKQSTGLVTRFSTAAPPSLLRTRTWVSSVLSHDVRAVVHIERPILSLPTPAGALASLPDLLHSAHLSSPASTSKLPLLTQLQPAPLASSLFLTPISSCPPQLHDLWLCCHHHPPPNCSKFLPRQVQTAAATATVHTQEMSPAPGNSPGSAQSPSRSTLQPQGCLLLLGHLPTPSAPAEELSKRDMQQSTAIAKGPLGRSSRKLMWHCYHLSTKHCALRHKIWGSCCAHD